MIKMIILILYIAIITTLSIIPAPDMPTIIVFPYFDKLVHLCMYAGLSFLMLWVWNEKTNKNKYLLILLIAFGCGLLMEFIQEISHLGRSFDILDIIANLLGFIPGLLFWRIIKSKILKAFV
jgi:VanZ family protein